MDARSLPGRTQGARKRAAHRDAMRKYEAGYMVGEWSGYSIPWDVCVAEARARYRIGEHLRPCRGCEACDPRVNDAMRPWCDGTGVLPARRA